MLDKHDSSWLPNLVTKDRAVFAQLFALPSLLLVSLVSPIALCPGSPSHASVPQPVLAQEVLQMKCI